MADDHTRTRLERWVHWSLLGGLVASGALLLLGLIVALATAEQRPGGKPPSPLATLHAAARGEGVALLDLGLILLVATPVLRVVVLLIGWSLAGDRRFAAVALAVLVLLGVGFALGVG